jgi:hypothetical protein
MKQWKKWIDVLEIKFHLIENIEWICIMQLELNVTQFNSNTQNMYFQSELNWTQHSSIGYNIANVFTEILIELNLVELIQMEFNWIQPTYEKKHVNLPLQSM